MKPLTWGDIIAYESVACILGMAVFAVIWFLTVLGFVGTNDILDAPQGVGAVLLVLGMVLSMLVNTAVVAAYIGESVTEKTAAGKVLQKYNRVLLALKASVIAYVLNLITWFVAAQVWVYWVWLDSGFQATNIAQGFINIPYALEYLAARGFGREVSMFWIASQVLYSVFSVFALKWVSPGQKEVTRRRPPRGVYRAPRR
jgi:hypothetical protein